MKVFFRVEPELETSIQFVIAEMAANLPSKYVSNRGKNRSRHKVHPAVADHSQSPK